MAEFSKIAWTDSTFNHIRGCTKVAAGCTNCYADAQSKRNPGVLGIWGPNGTRVVASESMWKQPLKWNREAQCNCGAAGMGEKQCKWCEGGCQRPRVFCASLADVFEEWDGQCKMSDGSWANNCYTNGALDRFAGVSLAKGTAATTLDHVRSRLFKLIDATPNLDWLLLTKRPENIRKMLVEHCLEKVIGHVSQNEGDGYHIRRRDNLWLGTSIAEQADVDRNIPHLLKCCDLSPVRFLSIEPLIGPVDLHSALYVGKEGGWEWEGAKRQMIDWVIVGGESGHHARPCHVDWVRSIVKQCQDADCSVFVKQLGSNCVAAFDDNNGTVTGRIHCSDPKGGDPDEWPEDLCVREFPAVTVN